MFLRKLAVLMFVGGFTFVGSVQAHDPSLHAKKVEKPNCAVMLDKDSDARKNLNPNDVVMMAMLKRCEKAAGGKTKPAMKGDHGHGDSHKDEHDKT